VGENVLGLVNWSGGLVFHEVQADLEAEGYEVQPYVLPAVSVNSPHRRDRVWFVAHSKCNGLEYRYKAHDLPKKEDETSKKISNPANDIKTNGSRFNTKWSFNISLENIVCRKDDGISDRLDSITFSKWRKESIKAFGNAIVPQVVYQIFKTIEHYENLQNL
jgi:DNA (cytosine-5)-methyltransferase 1